jgi:hypothetical protein
MLLPGNGPTSSMLTLLQLKKISEIRVIRGKKPFGSGLSRLGT